MPPQLAYRSTRLNRAENRQRRVHVTLELGWSADKQLQTFGRTHRSDQAVPPEYVLLSTELGGEKRFSSTIARRLGSLGALTKGDRGAADNNDLAKYNFETEEGRAALSLTLRRIMEGHSVAGLNNPRQALRDIGLLVASAEGGERIRKEDEFNVPRFLNRVLALDVDQQNALFDYFAELFDQTVRHAKANGTFDEGVTDIKALAVRVAKTPTIVHTDEITGAQTTHYMLEVDLPSNAVSFAEAEQIRQRKNGAFFVHRKKGNFILALESGRHTDPASGKSYRTFAIWKPEGARVAYMNETELSERYKAIGSERARSWWTQKHSSIPAIQTLETHILSGAIIPLWQRLKVNQDTTLRVVRVITEDQQRIVGIQLPNEKVGAVLCSLGLVRDLRDLSAIFHAVLDQGDEIELVSNLKLVRASLHSEPTVELRGADPNKFSQLRQLGLVNEQINWRQRFFIPTDETIGVTTLSSLLAQYPIVVSTEAETAQEVIIEASNDVTLWNMIDLNEWIIDTSIKMMVDEIDRGNEDEQTTDHELITIDRTLSVTSVDAPDEESQQQTSLAWFGQATTATQLTFSFA